MQVPLLLDNSFGNMTFSVVYKTVFKDPYFKFCRIKIYDMDQTNGPADSQKS